ncbi:ABC transporter permease [Actinospongicola halichondriae]|uniref:ABC transporter permease n=1 Tax=Actinospongicola halichondriae TaxID=3236844 RepID=UPI003D385FA5
MAGADASAAGGRVLPDLIVIEPRARTPILPLAELRQRYELLGFLVWRDIKIRYKQTALGVVWALLQPLLAMLVFTVVFGRLARVGSDDVPYSLFAYAGLVPWLYASNALALSSNSLVDNEKLLSKVYLPRIMMPLSPILAGLLDLGIALVLLCILTMIQGVGLSWTVVAVVPFVLLVTIGLLGAGALLSSLNVKYRDVRYAVPFFIQVGMFATPVVYPSSLVPDAWRPVYALNPMVTAIDGVRWSVLGTPFPPATAVIASVAAAVLMLVGGCYAFHRSERTFADAL